VQAYNETKVTKPLDNICEGIDHLAKNKTKTAKHLNDCSQLGCNGNEMR
jgi:hypothetical protein